MHSDNLLYKKYLRQVDVGQKDLKGKRNTTVDRKRGSLKHVHSYYHPW
jgi:hypothetical protein